MITFLHRARHFCQSWAGVIYMVFFCFMGIAFMISVLEGPGKAYTILSERIKITSLHERQNQERLDILEWKADHHKHGGETVYYGNREVMLPNDSGYLEKKTITVGPRT